MTYISRLIIICPQRIGFNSLLDLGYCLGAVDVLCINSAKLAEKIIDQQRLIESEKKYPKMTKMYCIC